MVDLTERLEHLFPNDQFVEFAHRWKVALQGLSEVGATRQFYRGIYGSVATAGRCGGPAKLLKLCRSKALGAIAMPNTNDRSTPRNVLKMTSEEDNSGSVVFAFAGRWKAPLVAGDVKVFFRKRGPTRAPKYVYFYVSLPTSSIIGRARILSLERLSISEALLLSEKGMISREELGRYARGSNELCVIKFGSFQQAKTPIGMAQLKKDFACLPPQNFFFLSKEGKAILDEIAGF